MIKKSLRKHMNILITAGPTREPIDPVRFLSNYSTGEMGYAIAQEAKQKGHRVILISGPSGLKVPENIKLINVETTRDMEKSVENLYKWADCVIMASAVSDYRVEKAFSRKIKSKKSLNLKLVRNPDILKELGSRLRCFAPRRDPAETRQRRGACGKKYKILAGFALESENLRENALKKLKEKNLDIIVANKIGKRSPFGAGKTSVLVLDKLGKAQSYKDISKKRVAGILLDKIEGLC